MTEMVKVLLVEDNTYNQAIISKLLQMHSYQVRSIFK